METDIKSCNHCGQEFPLSMYGNNKSNKDGLQAYCNHCGKEMRDRWVNKNKEKKLQSAKLYLVNNPEKRKETIKNYYQKTKNNPLRKEKKREYRRKYINTPAGAIHQRVSCAIWRCLNGQKNFKKWEALVGYTLQDLMEHLIKTIPAGYCKEDICGGVLHIDHIIPISIFNITSDQCIDFKRCWSLNNLRLLPAFENLSKHDKILTPFQPALDMAV
jgi:hypothetical protein